MSTDFNLQRVRKLNTFSDSEGGIIYWMNRDQRVDDNWALLFAQKLAIQKKVPFCVVFCLQKSFLGATIRQYDFMLKGLEELESRLGELNINFYLLEGAPDEVLPEFIKQNQVSSLITDFSPLKIKKLWLKNLLQKVTIPVYEVDSHNIIPVWIASNKLEFAAYTIRPKIHKLLPEFLTSYPQLLEQELSWHQKKQNINWFDFENSLEVNLNVKAVDWIKPGQKAADIFLDKFLKQKLNSYNEDRNDPTLDGQSNLSPYLHFGQISAQKIAMEVVKTNISKIDEKNNQATSILDILQNKDTSEASFLEELIVRRELADNYCYYEENYDDFEGFHIWAKTSLNEHRKDKREFVYSLEEFEEAKTHDDLWNAAQIEMTQTGKMHGFMRMYWAKKILEWTQTPEEAMKVGIYLNDKYELDGRDPNGYTGIAWSIGGVHDRAWNEREVFGKIRFMNYNGCKRKFDIKKYIQKFGDENKTLF